MSENDLEKPLPDTIEQGREAVADPERPFAETPASQGLEADEADAAEQLREVDLDEDDYR